MFCKCCNYVSLTQDFFLYIIQVLLIKILIFFAQVFVSLRKLKILLSTIIFVLKVWFIYII